MDIVINAVIIHSNTLYNIHTGIDECSQLCKCHHVIKEPELKIENK